MLRDDEDAADLECRAWLGPALDEFTIVPSPVADRLVGPPVEPPSLDRLRKEALVLAREIGRLQTGKLMDTGWAMQCLAILGLDALGVETWDCAAEDNRAALEAVIARAKEQCSAARVESSCRELDRLDAPF